MEENHFGNALLIDNRTGRVSGADVCIEGDEFVFTPSAKPGGETAIAKAPDLKQEPFLGFSRIRAEAAAREKRGGAGSFDEALVAELLRFAAVHGPLFGFAGLVDGKPEIREPVSDWRAAQQVMERALKAEVFSRGGELDKTDIDESFKVTVIPGGETNRWSYVIKSI